MAGKSAKLSASALEKKRAAARAYYHAHKGRLNKARYQASREEGSENNLPPGAKRALLKALERAYIAELKRNGGQLNDLVVRAYAVCRAFQ